MSSEESPSSNNEELLSVPKRDELQLSPPALSPELLQVDTSAENDPKPAKPANTAAEKEAILPDLQGSPARCNVSETSVSQPLPEQPETDVLSRDEEGDDDDKEEDNEGGDVVKDIVPVASAAASSSDIRTPQSPRRLTSMGDIQPSTGKAAKKTSSPREPRLLSAKKSSDVNWNVRRHGSKLVAPSSAAVAPPPSNATTITDDTQMETTSRPQLPPSTVAVFNANTTEGGSMVRALSGSGQNVIAVVRVFTSKNTKRLLKLPNTSVKVADSHDEAALTHAVTGAHRAFLVTKYWETFDSWMEESQANIIVRACGNAGVAHLVLSSVEDTRLLRDTGCVSQIVPDRHGVIHPKFEGMRNLRQDAQQRGVLLTHMLTSYVDQEQSKRSVALIMSERGRLVVSETGL